MEDLKMDDSKRARSDHTRNLDPHLRRLDALARLLAAQSICVAVVVFNKKLYVAANELTIEVAKEHPLLSTLEDITGYFSSLANRQQVEETRREEIFKKSCSVSRLNLISLGAGGQEFVVSEKMSQEAAKAIFDHTTNSITLYQALYEQGEQAIAYGFACGEYTQLYIDFSKLEEIIKNSIAEVSYSKNEKLTDDELIAFKSDINPL